MKFLPSILVQNITYEGTKIEPKTIISMSHAWDKCEQDTNKILGIFQADSKKYIKVTTLTRKTNT